MNIAFIASGVSTHTVKWVNALVAREHQVWLISVKGDSGNKAIDKRVEQIVLPFRAPLGYYLNGFLLKKIIEKIKPDIINAHYASGYGTLVRIAGLSKDAILSVWGSDIYDFPYKNKIAYGIIKKNLLSAKQIASTSNNMAEQVKSLAGDVLVSVTPFGVDITKYSVKLSKEHGDSFVIGTVKTLEKNYRIDYLIKSISILMENLQKVGSDKVNKIKVKIYGGGSQKEYLRDLIVSYDLNNIVELKGYIPHDEVPKALAEMDVFVALSEKESFGVSILEAYAAGVPVIVSDALGFKEIVLEGETGYIIEGGNPNKVAEKLEVLLNNKALRDKMGVGGFKHVKKFYSWDKSVDIMESVYNKNIIRYLK